MDIKDIQSIEGIQLKRKEVLKDYENWLKKNPTAYSFPFHQMKAIEEQEYKILAGAYK